MTPITLLRKSHQSQIPNKKNEVQTYNFLMVKIQKVDIFLRIKIHGNISKRLETGII